VVVLSQDRTLRGWQRTEQRGGVEYHVAGSFPGNSYIEYSHSPLNLLRFQAHRANDADVYHLFQPFANSSLYWLRMQKTRPGAVFVWDWDDLWAGGLLLRRNLHYRVMKYFEKALPRKADGVTVCSRFLAERAEANGAKSVRKIWNGYTPCTPVERSVVRAEFGLPPESLLLLFMGWTPGETGWIFQAYREIRARNWPVELVWLGVPPDKVSGINVLGGAPLHFLGSRPRSEAMRVAQACDIGLLPLADTLFNQSRLPMKFADYVGAGLSVCCSAVGEIVELARHAPEQARLTQTGQDAWARGLFDLVERQLVFGRKRTWAAVPALEWSGISEELERYYLELRTAKDNPSGKSRANHV